MKQFIQSYGTGSIYKDNSIYIIEISGRVYKGKTIDEALSNISKKKRVKKIVKPLVQSN